MNHRIALVLGMACAALSSLGCYAYAEPPVVYADTSVSPVEVDIASYPSTYYEGRPVYYYRDHWYYRDGARWSYYRVEPPTLSRQRTYVQQAAPARRVAHPGAARPQVAPRVGYPREPRHERERPRHRD